MNVTRIIVIATLLVAFVATSAGTSFAATRSNPSQTYTPPAQSVATSKLPNGSAVNTATVNAQNVSAAGVSLAGIGGLLAGVAAFVSVVSSSSSSGIVNPINSNVSSSARSAFGR